MAAPLYFLPGATAERDVHNNGPTPDVLAKHGVFGIVRDVPPGAWMVQEMTKTTPADNQPGLMVCPHTAAGELPARFGYYPPRQTWAKLPGATAWVGIDDQDALPGPAELARREMVPGYEVKLGDGNTWRVPILRGHDNDTRLPRSFGWDAAGNMQLTLRPEFQSVFEAFAPVAALYYTGDPPPCTLYGPPIDDDGSRLIEFEPAAELCLRALELNYRLDKITAARLALLDTANFQNVLKMAIDEPRSIAARAAQKKTESGP